MDEDRPDADEPLTDDERVDEASMESFPASDPPGYRSLSIGGPAKREEEPEET